jgi:hypothetical protein
LRAGHPLARDLVGFYTPEGGGSGGEARDLGSAGLTGWLGSGVLGAAGAFGRVFRFDGSAGGVIDVPVAGVASYQSDTWALTCRFRSADLSGSRRLISVQGGGGVLWHLRSHNGQPSCAFRDSGGSLKAINDPGVSLTRGRWYTMTSTIDASRTIRLYLDGRLIGSATLAGAGDLRPTEPLRLGQYTATQARFKGDMDYAAIHRRALSGSEVALLHTSPFAMARGGVSPWLGWGGEVGCVPGGPGGVSLAQSAEASFPDRGTVGLKVTLEAGGDGRYLERDLGVSRSTLHARVMLNPGTVGGGWVSLMRGLDSEGGESFRLVYTPSSREVSVVLGTGAELKGVLPVGLDWHCVELKVDAGAGAASLWVNGVEAETRVGPLSGLSVRRVWLGAPHKQGGAVGDLYLDDWMLGDAYLGPAPVEPTSEHADDPARWLVVYNTADADSVAWAAWYRAARGVPYANLLGLAAPVAEEVSEPAFVAWRQAISNYLSLNGLNTRVMGILCGPGIPGTYEDAGGVSESVAGQLHRIDCGAGVVANGLARGVDDATMERPTVSNLLGNLLTARIDGSDLASARLPVERAMTFEVSGFDGAGVGAGSDAKIWLDPYGADGVSDEAEGDRMLAWSSSGAGGLTRLERVLPTAPTGGEDPSHGTIEEDGFFWGWGAAAPDARFFGSSSGRRLFCGVLWYANGTCGSLRGGASGWASAALGAGYAAVGVSTRARSASSAPHVAGFFGALRRGWTLGEAWFVSCPELRSGLTLVGDPLARFALPHRGWNVYGPFASWSGVDVSGEPRVALRAEERTLALSGSALPAEGAVGLYLVRGVDALGREEAGGRHVRFVRSGGVGLGLSWAPAWPSAPGWTAPREGDGWRLSAAWGARFGALGVSRVDLVEGVQGAGEAVVASEAVDGRASRVSWRRAPGGVAVRYRFDVISEAGGVESSAWSGWMTLAPLGSIGLTRVSIGAS